MVDRNPVGVIEAKKAGKSLGSVNVQAEQYLWGITKKYPKSKPAFAYESNGFEIYFRDARDPRPRSRRIFHFHKPEELKRTWNLTKNLRTQLSELPEYNPLLTSGLRKCQVEAITNLEVSFADDKPKALIQMATGSGKTYTAVTFAYRLIKFAKAKRILFLVDRRNLGRQTLKEFQQYSTPNDRRKFTELYNVQLLSTKTLDDVANVCITTVQRLFSLLKGDEKFDYSLEEKSLFNYSVGDEEEIDIKYSKNIPIEHFDFIIVDECHRSIYNKWRQVIEYFDAFIIGLTATPSAQTFGFFNQNLVTEYNHESAVVDGVNVGYEIYEIKTEISERGTSIKAGKRVYKRNRETREQRWSKMDEDTSFKPQQLDRDVVSKNQIRTIIKTLKQKLPTEIFPGRNEVPKTLIFAKSDSHAEDILHIVREEFGKGNKFAEKITYTAGKYAEQLIKMFRNSYNPRIAITVDMISTGTDIKPLECLVFMRNIKSRIYFEQMKGRGTRTINSTDLQAVTKDARTKTHFVLVDAIGVTETDKTETQPMDREPYIEFEKLIEQIALGQRTDDKISTLAARISRFNLQLDEEQKEEIKTIIGKDLTSIARDLIQAIDPDIIITKAKEEFATENPTYEQLEKIKDGLITQACIPFEDPKVRKTLVNIKKKNEQIIDVITPDRVISTGFTEEQAKNIIKTFDKFLEEQKDEITALQILFSKPYGQRNFTFKQIKELANAIETPPYSLTTERIWEAYKRLETNKVRKAGSQQLLANIISIIRFKLNESTVLEPFSDTVNNQFEEWLKNQTAVSKTIFTTEQIEWLNMIKKALINSINFEFEDFQYPPFSDKGGVIKATKLFGDKLVTILDNMAEVLVG